MFLREDLCERLALTATALESLVHALSEDIDVSVGRVLAASDGRGPMGPRCCA